MDIPGNLENSPTLGKRNLKCSALGGLFSNRIQIAASGTNHTVTTDKNKTVQSKLISNATCLQKSPNSLPHRG